MSVWDSGSAWPLALAGMAVLWLVPCARLSSEARSWQASQPPFLLQTFQIERIWVGEMPSGRLRVQLHGSNPPESETTPVVCAACTLVYQGAAALLFGHVPPWQGADGLRSQRAPVLFDVKER